MFQNDNGYFCENSPGKLLLNIEKCKSLIMVATEKAVFDPTLPISIELHLTNKCNLDCKWCVDRGIRDNLCELPFDALVRFLDDIVDTNIGVTLEGGGEPTIYPLFEDFVLEASKRKVALGLISNGVRAFSTDLIKYFQWIRISVDAGTSQEYIIGKGADQFENVLSNLEVICKNKMDTLVGVGYVLTKNNFKNVSNFLWRIQAIGVDYIQIRIVEENDNLLLSPKMLFDFKKSIGRNFNSTTLNINQQLDINHTDNKNLPCVAHSLRSIIHADGLVYLCEKRRHDPIILGNMIENSFTDLWNSRERVEASQKLIYPISQIGCVTCRITKFNEIFNNMANIKTKNFI